VDTGVLRCPRGEVGEDLVGAAASAKSTVAPGSKPCGADCIAGPRFAASAPAFSPFVFLGHCAAVAEEFACAYCLAALLLLAEPRAEPQLAFTVAVCERGRVGAVSAHWIATVALSGTTRSLLGRTVKSTSLNLSALTSLFGSVKDRAPTCQTPSGAPTGMAIEMDTSVWPSAGPVCAFLAKL
jgi:hypothetical protein